MIAPVVPVKSELSANSLLLLSLLWPHLAVADSAAAAAAATTTGWQRIHSPQLEYDLQYQAIPSPGYQPGDPVLYATDGAWYAAEGQLPELIVQLRAEGKIRPLLLVLVDARDPADLSVNRRHQQFMCN